MPRSIEFLLESSSPAERERLLREAINALNAQPAFSSRSPEQIFEYLAQKDAEAQAVKQSSYLTPDNLDDLSRFAGKK